MSNGRPAISDVLGANSYAAAMSSDNWKKSSKCAGNGACVEVRLPCAPAPETADPSLPVVGLRRTGHPAVLHFSREEWAAFIEGARNGEFDL